MSHPLDALFGRALVRRALKQRIDEPRPTCHYCGRRVPVNALVRRRGQLVKPTHRNGLFGFRTFRPHNMKVGGPCKGSGQEMFYARGFDR